MSIFLYLVWIIAHAYMIHGLPINLITSALLKGCVCYICIKIVLLGARDLVVWVSPPFLGKPAGKHPDYLRTIVTNFVSL